MTNPNPFTPTEKAFIRTISGYANAFARQNPYLNGLFDSIDGLYDDPTDAGATQALIRTYIAAIQSLDAKITANESLFLATEIEGEIMYDAARSDVMLKESGRKYINRLCRAMSFFPRDDYDYYEGPETTAGEGEGNHYVVGRPY